MKKLLFVLIIIPTMSFSQTEIGIGKMTELHYFKVSIRDSIKEVAYLDADSCLHVIDSLATINTLIKVCFQNNKEELRLSRENDKLIDFLSEYMKEDKDAKRVNYILKELQSYEE